MDLTVNNLSKSYGPQKAVDNISFRLREGELLGFLGPNGAGKSTTMRILSCFMAPDSGEVLYNSKPVTGQITEFKRKIGYLSENNPLYPEMYIIDFLKYIAALQDIPRKNRMNRVREMIDYCGLEKEKHKKIGELSKGYRQRVGLAQALIHDPEVLILDEPTSGLDPNQIIEIREYIKKMGQEKAIILSTHILPEAEATCERIIIINKGRIIADDSRDNLKNLTQEQTIVEVEIDCDIPASGIIQELEGLTGTAEAEHTGENTYAVKTENERSTRAEISHLCSEKKWHLLSLYTKKTSLEDIFRKITK